MNGFDEDYDDCTICEICGSRIAMDIGIVLCPNHANHPPRVDRPFDGSLFGNIDQLAEARAILVKIQDSLTVYEQAPGDRTRGWCGDLGTYLRGEVGVRGTIDPDVWAGLERITGITSQRHLPD